MSVQPGRPTATIIPFVPRGRTAGAAHRPAAAVRDGRVPPTLDCGAGWYHEAAMQEEARGRRP